MAIMVSALAGPNPVAGTGGRTRRPRPAGTTSKRGRSGAVGQEEGTDAGSGVPAAW